MTKTKIGTLVALLFSAALLAASFTCLTTPQARAAGMPTEEFKAKTPGIPASTIQTVSAFDLNDAKVVGGGAKVPDPVAPGATAITSPDGNFKLIQGTRMFVEYANKAAIKDTGGKYQLLPGSITLKWDDAAVDKTTGKPLDVQLTISGLNSRILDYGNKKTIFSRQEIESTRIMALINWPWPDASHKDDLHAPGKISPEKHYKEKRFSSLSTTSSALGSLNMFYNSSNFTINFLNKDGTVNPGRYNMVITDIDNAGFAGSPGKWYVSLNRTDRAQEHIKLLTPGDSLHVTKDTVLWTGKGNPKKEAWCTKSLSWYQTEGWALANIGSGSTIETGNNGGMNLFGQLDPLFSKITVTKKGDGLTPGKTFLTGTNVNFTYEVENVGVSKVSGIKVTDSKGVEVTCPKTVLQPKEKMTCTGTGKVMDTPGFIVPPNPGSGDVKDPSGLNED